MVVERVNGQEDSIVCEMNNRTKLPDYKMLPRPLHGAGRSSQFLEGSYNWCSCGNQMPSQNTGSGVTEPADVSDVEVVCDQ